MARRHYHSAICDPNVFIQHYTERDETGDEGGREDGGEAERGEKKWGWNEGIMEKEKKLSAQQPGVQMSPDPVPSPRMDV